MNDKIIELREKLVELSKDPIETRKLLDQLTEAEIDQNNIESPFHVGKNDIEATKDGDVYKLYKTKGGFLLHYHGGYSVLVDERMISASSALQEIMDGVPADVTDKETRDDVQLMLDAAEFIFRLPQFIFSNPAVTLNIATMGVQYMNLLQKMGEIPIEETENPEYDKFIVQMNEMMENFAAGLEKEGLEYERRNGLNNGERKEQADKGESESKGEGEAKEGN